jgi:integral membrane protein
MNLLTTPLGRLRLVGFIEGVSYLLLLGVCMPLKYFADWPQPVKYVGWAHGVLFVLYGVAVLQAAFDRNWKFTRFLLAGVVSLVPFGTFWFDGSLRREQEAEQQEEANVS